MSYEIIKRYSILAKKSLWQNFLINQEILEEIVSIVDIHGKNIIEVWPGYGALTEKILGKKPQSLHLVELDKDMISILKERKNLWEFYLQDTDFCIYHEDILKFIPRFEKYSVIANIPYYITSPILHHFLYNLDYIPESLLILMQKDVAEKILGGKKNKTSVIRLALEKKCHITEKMFVPKENFYPVPKVESSVLFFETHTNFSHIDDEEFLELIKKWFSEPRKKLIKNLVKWWYESEKIFSFYQKNNFDENLRGEDMSLETWCQLCDIL